MDNHERRQRQSNASSFAAQQQHPHHQHHPSTGGGPAYRQQGQQQPVPVQPAGPAAIQSARSIASQGAMPPSAYPPPGAGAHPHGFAAAPSAAYEIPAYAAEFSQESARPVQPQTAAQQQQVSQQQQQQQSAGAQQQAQGSPQYPGMYGFQQGGPQQQPTPPTPYDAVQPYPPARQSAAIEVLSNQFGMPQGYYVAGDGGPGGPAGPTSAPVAAAAAMAAQQQQQGVQQPYGTMGYATTQSPPIGREALVPGYAMADPAVASAAAGPPPGTPGSQGAFGQPGAYAPQTTELDNAYGSYVSELRRTFENVHDGLLADVGTSLIRISDWLLTNADTLGLVRDEEAMNPERLKLWTEFNNCWLVALQRQKELTLDARAQGRPGARPAPPLTLMEPELMESMGKEIVRLCDIMEKFGLVDYEMGVWEEDIINLLTECLDLMEEAGQPTGGPVQQPPTTRRR